MEKRTDFSKTRQRLAFRLLLVGFVALTGCANVAPYEREDLADPIMQLDEGPQGAYEQHLHRALEGGLSGQPAAGGGCGCEQ